MSTVSGNFYGGIIKDGIFVHVDAAKRESYPRYGSFLYDLTKNKKNGTLYNDVFFDENYKGSLAFDGVDDYIDFGNISSFLSVGNMQFWMYSTEVIDYRNVLTTGDLTNDNNCIRFEQYSNPTPYGGFSVSVGGSGSNLFDYSPGSILTQDTWYHVSFNWDKTNNIVIGHLNGVEKFNTANSTWPTADISLKLGVGYSATRYFKGNISWFVLYTRTLSNLEILRNYNTTKSRYGL